MSGPLAGLKVLDLTTVVLGPYATQILGDYGANVIKIERPGGDSSRYMTPGRTAGMSGIAMSLHRNKRSIVLDLKTGDDRGVLYRLVETADILIHNMLPSVVEILDISYERLSAINPSLIYCITTGFAEDGPYAGKPAYDDLIQGASGIASLMQQACGEPRYFPGVLCDKITGMAAVNAVLSAVIHRQNTGNGQRLVVPMFETMVAFNLVEHSADALFSPAESSYGYKRVMSENRKPYKTADSYICVLPYSDRDWRRFFALIDQPELGNDPRFATMAERSKNIDTLYALIASSMPARATADWLEQFQQAGIAAMPVTALADIERDAHIQATAFFQERVHPTQGAYREIAIPVHFSASVPEQQSPAPRLNEHGQEIRTKPADSVWDKGTS